LHDQNSDSRAWFINNGVQALDLSTLPRCQAVAASTGEQCKRAALKGQKCCGIHSGRYKPGARAGNKNAERHGQQSERTRQERAEARDILRALTGLSGDLSSKIQSPITHIQTRSL
jgi:hypothetical protein